MKFRFIASQRKAFSLTRLCAALGISRSGYYAWQRRPASARKMANQALLKQIRAVHAQTAGTYGSPRVYRELRAQGVGGGKNRIARLMRVHGLQAIQTKCSRPTTRRNPAHTAAPNLLAGDFAARRPNEKWLADISYIPTREGWLYLAAVMDLFSRRIVGWAMDRRMTGTLIASALEMALHHRQPAQTLIHHSDRGSQYTGRDYQQLLARHQLQASMSSRGNCYDNAPMESFFGTLKTERVHHRLYRTRQEARTDLFFYIEAFYNRRRRHSSLDYLSPADFELVHDRHPVLSFCP